MRADDDGDAQLQREVSGFLAKRDRHESLASTLPLEEFIRLRGLGEIWGLLFDVARGELSPAAGWESLSILLEIYQRV